MKKVKLDAVENIQAWGTRKDPATSIRLFQFGANKTSKGTFYLTKKDALNILKKKEDRGNFLLADFEHSMAESAPEGAPASAKFKLGIKSDGLYAINIQWSDRALEYFAKREYFYYSPYAIMEKRLDGNDYVIDVVNFALTNTPATDNMIPLILDDNQKLARNCRYVMLSDKITFNNNLDKERLNMNEELKKGLLDLLASAGLAPEAIDALADGILKLVEADNAAEEAAPGEPAPAPSEELSQVLSDIASLKAEVVELRKIKSDHQVLLSNLKAKAPTVKVEELAKPVALSLSDKRETQAKALSQKEGIPFVNAYLKVLRESK